MGILAASNAGSGMSSLIIIILMIAFMYFFMIRPQQKQRKEHQSMVDRLKKGDHVVMISRLHGVIDEINKNDQTVTIDCEGVYLTFDLSAIARVIPSQTATADSATSAASESASAVSEAAEPASAAVSQASESVQNSATPASETAQDSAASASSDSEVK